MSFSVYSVPSVANIFGRKAMIVDHRTYNVKLGKMNEYLKLYET